MEEQKKQNSRKKIPDGTVLDYVRWRGDLSFAESGWNEIDSVIAALISYANFGENELSFGNGQGLRLGSLATSELLDRCPQDGIADTAEIRNCFLREMAESRRFQDIVIPDQVNDVDPARNIQFSAITMAVPDTGTVVAFRGTDTSLVGWKEDFMLCYMTPVPAQSAALAYLEQAAAGTTGPIILVGHSKGGNLALYSAAHTSPEIRERIREIYSFDGPGLDDDTVASEGYRSIEPLIRSFVPAGSMVGMLLNYNPVYRVVRTKKVSFFFQHDPFNWLVMGRHFLEEESVTDVSRIVDRTTHEWFRKCTPEQREVFVTTLFSRLDKKAGEKEEDADPADKTDDGGRKMMLSMVNRLISIYAGETWYVNIRRPLIQASEALRLKLKALQGDIICSETIRIDNRGNGFKDAADEAEKMALSSGLNHRDTLRLVLFTEEMLSMIHIVTGELTASFRIERIGLQFELLLTVRTEMDKKKKRLLKASAASGKQKGSFLDKLRSVFERAMASDSGDDVCFDLPESRIRLASGEWDGYERSVLVKLADGLRITIHGSEVRMSVRKDFS